MKTVAATLIALFLLGPAILVFGVGMIANPGAQQGAICAADSLTVGPIPDSLDSETADGTPVTVTRTQLEHAATIITDGSRIDGVTRDAVVIALMAALTESRLRQLANTTVYPESADYPHDGDGADNDSLGLFQMRPQSGWGTVAELMDVGYQVRAFFGGPTGPNFPSPRGLLDIPGWETMEPGAVAQAVEVSDFPDRYQNWEPVALDILDALTTTSPGNEGTGEDPDPEVPETRRLVFPLEAGVYVRTSPFGGRDDPFTGEYVFHSGVDLAAPDGTPILALADGVVVEAGMIGGYSGQVAIEHTIDGKPVASRYVHMWSHGIHVQVGDRVQAGDHIADVGSSGYSTGPHLHLQIHPGGANADPVDPEPWLAAHDVEFDDAPDTPTGGGCF